MTEQKLEVGALEVMARGAGFIESLQAICSLVEEHVAPPGSVASVMVFDEGRLVARAAPSLPSFVGVVLTPGPCSGSCGAAAASRRPEFVFDTLEDDRWSELRDVATETGIRSCWSIPVMNREDEVVATFAISGFEPGLPSPRQEEALRVASALVRLALEREQDRARHERLEQQLRVSRQLEGLGVLAGGVAHDFNNLLSVIVGNAEMSLEHDDMNLVRPRLERIRKVALQGGALCRQILDYAGREQRESEPVRFDELVGETVDLCRSHAQGRARIELHALEELVVEGSQTRLQQVAQNLILNAVDAAEQGGSGVEVRLERTELTPSALELWDLAGRAGEVALLKVRDEGPGMSPEVRERIFEPFFTTKPQGRGLGLAATLGILHRHEGSLRVVTSPQGSTFEVALPLAAPSSPVEQPEPETRARAARILVVEDDPGVAEVVVHVLAKEHSVEHVPDGVTALAKLEEGSAFDLLVLDLSLPKMDGEEVYRRLRARGIELPVLFSSGRGDAPAVKDPRTAYLSKPYVGTELRDLVQRLLSQA